jgi:hypothetical protein
MAGLRAATVALLTAMLAGCGHTEALKGTRTLDVALSEYRVAPQSSSVSAGDLTVLVHNYGRLTHNLVISRDGQAAAMTRPVAPGQTAEITLTLSRGTYLMASTMLSDQSLGAYGTLRVTQ